METPKNPQKYTGMQQADNAVKTGGKPRSPYISEGVTLSVAPMMDCGDNGKNVFRSSGLWCCGKSV